MSVNAISSNYSYHTEKIDKKTSEGNSTDVSLLELNSNSDKTVLPSKISNLQMQYDNAKNEQGVIGKIADGVKNLFKTKNCSDNIQKAINNLDENSSEEEIKAVQDMLDKYNSNQDSAVSGTASAGSMAVGGFAGAKIGAAIGTAIFPGLGTGAGFLIGIVGGALAGALTNVGINQIENMSDNVKNNSWLQDKKLLSEAGEGALAGGSSVLMGGLTSKLTSAIGSKVGLESVEYGGKKAFVELTKDGTAKIGKTVAKNALVNGLSSGVASSAVADGEYMLKCAVSKDKEFSATDLATTSLTSFAFGSLIGSATGGLQGYKGAKDFNIAQRESVIQARILDAQGENGSGLGEETVRDLSEKSDKLHREYARHEKEATEQIKKTFEELDSVEEVTGRAKSENSTFEKLANKSADGKLKSNELEACREKIGDAYGTRIKMKNLDSAEVERILKEEGLECSYEDFCKILEKSDNLTDSEKLIINALKERQSSETFDLLIDKIKNDRNFQITELNNYGDDTTSYFTTDQIKKIAKVYRDTTGERLTVVTKRDSAYGHMAFNDELGKEACVADDYIIIEKGAVKESGYTTTQMNTKQIFKDSTVGNGELQIRGVEVNKFGDIEHIPYDIRKGKIKPDDSKYGEIYSIIKGLDEPSYSRYNEYLSKVYKHLRLKELGINTPMPEIGTGYTTTITDGTTKITKAVDVSKIDYEGLMKQAH